MSELDKIKNTLSNEVGYESFDEYIKELFTPNSNYSLERLNIFIKELCDRIQNKQQ